MPKSAEENSSNIDFYIAATSAVARPVLAEIRRRVKRAIPTATETIGYKMPAFRMEKIFFYFAAFKGHIGIYPPLNQDKALIKQLQPYRNEKGNLRFPLDEPMPYELIVQVAEALKKEYAEQ
jgi:uncharacterized protein YdhG (YjbR/CyaY superfamily)